ncbi:serine/threonine-protein kinase PK-1 [bacterium BMS3Abin14]|nr:serine/threonine-protein kinase PK-1 [bacterium BMS3Abin14]
MNRFGILGKILLLASAMVLVTVLSAWVIFTFLTRGGEVTVPDVKGQEMGAALEILSRQKLGLSIAATDYDASVLPEHVISQDPDAGVRTRKNRIIRVVMSLGTRTVHVPNLAGLSLRRVELQLSQSGLKVGKVARAHLAETDSGTVISQAPLAGVFAARGQEVDVLLSEGAPVLTYLLPDLTGFPVEDVLATIRAWGLKAGRINNIESTDLPPGTVTATHPLPGSAVQEGQTVNLTVTTLPKPGKTFPIVLYQYVSPPGFIPHHLRLVLSAGQGASEVFSQMIEPGTSVTIPVPVPRTGILRAYVDGSLLEEKDVP